MNGKIAWWIWVMPWLVVGGWFAVLEAIMLDFLLWELANNPLTLVGLVLSVAALGLTLWRIYWGPRWR